MLRRGKGREGRLARRPARGEERLYEEMEERVHKGNGQQTFAHDPIFLRKVESDRMLLHEHLFVLLTKKNKTKTKQKKKMKVSKK